MPAIMTNTGVNSKLSRSAMRGANQENFGSHPGRSIRPPLRMLYLHSVAKRTFIVRHPLFPKLTLRGCEDGERSVLCALIPDPVVQASPDQERGGIRTDDNEGWVVAIDVLNPGNFTYDQYFGSANPDWFANRNGTNLSAEGIFISETEEPTEEEVKRAEHARDSHYRWLTKEAMRLASVSKKQLDEFLQRYPDTHVAMASLKLKAEWTSTPTVTIQCDNCGDDIRQGLAFHLSSVTGKICVIDPMKAYKAKAITRDEYEELTGEVLPGRRASTA